MHLNVHFDADPDVDVNVDVVHLHLKNVDVAVVHLNMNVAVDFADASNTRMGLKYFSSFMNMGSYHLHLPAIATV